MRSGATALETLDDAALARRARRDPAAFSELVRRHTPALRRYALRLGAGGDADDVVQEALLKAWRQVGSFDPSRASLTTWLHRIVHNQAIDTWRRRPPTDSMQAEQDEHADPHADAERAAVNRDVWRVLDALPERQRAALVLRQLQGFSQREAAAILDVSEDALESLVARARRALRERLQSNNT